MPKDKRHATGSGGGRLASEDRTGKVAPDVLNVQYNLEGTSNPFKVEDPEQGWFASLSPQQLRKLILLGVCTLVGVAAVVWNALDRSDAQGVVEPLGHRSEADSRPPTLVDTLSAEELQVVAERTVRDFMNATGAEERVRLVFPGEGVGEKIKDYYERPGNKAPKRFGGVKELKAAAFDGTPLYWCKAKVAGSDDIQFFNLVPLKDRMVIEWESSVAYGEVSWEKFLLEKPADPRQMRVMVEGSNYYNHEFSDDKTYKAFTLTGHGLDGVLNAYVERDSAAGRELAWVGRTPGKFRYNLRLQRSGGGDEARQVRILDVVHQQWADGKLLEEVAGK